SEFLLCPPPLSLDAKRSLSLRVGLAEPVARVRDREAAVRVCGNLQPIGRRVTRGVAPPSTGRRRGGRGGAARSGSRRAGCRRRWWRSRRFGRGASGRGARAAAARRDRKSVGEGKR